MLLFHLPHDALISLCAKEECEVLPYEKDYVLPMAFCIGQHHLLVLSLHAGEEVGFMQMVL